MIKLILSLLIACSIIPISSVLSQENINLLKSHEISPPVFTQGLEVYQEQLVLGSGLYGESFLAYVDLETGKVEPKVYLDDRYFGEGITFTDKYLWQITWREATAFKRDLDNFQVLDQVAYEGEGWGIAYDEDLVCLWMTDGSHRIYQRDPESFKLMDAFEIYYQGQAVNRLNELEYYDGYLYANIWYANQIIAINIQTMEVESVFDMTPIIEAEFTPEQSQEIDSLNGIAYKEDNIFYVTGKYYPKIFEVELTID